MKENQNQVSQNRGGGQEVWGGQEEDLSRVYQGDRGIITMKLAMLTFRRDELLAP